MFCLNLQDFGRKNNPRYNFGLEAFLPGRSSLVRSKVSD